MKYLEAQALKAKRAQEENKMQPGSRVDQRNDQSVASLAHTIGVDIAKVKPSTEGGEVTAKDVRVAAKDARAKNQIEQPISGRVPKHPEK